MSDEIEATQPGVEKVELVSAHEDRLSVIEAIASGMSPEDPKDEEVIPEEGAEAEVIEKEVAEEPAEEIKTRKLKVEGEEVEKTEEEIIEAGIRALQKESSADKRLEEATQLLKEAKEQQNLQPSKESTDTPGDAGDVVTQEDQPPLVDAETMQKIQYGTEEEARAALDGVIRAAQVQPTPQPQPNVDEAVQTALDRRDLTSRLETEFPEIFKDPRLHNMARLEIQDKLDAGEPSSYETYQEVLTGVMEWRGTKEDDGMTKREEKKAAASVTSIKTASATKSVEPEEKPQTTQEVIDEMARSRGQMT